MNEKQLSVRSTLGRLRASGAMLVGAAWILVTSSGCSDEILDILDQIGNGACPGSGGCESSGVGEGTASGPEGTSSQGSADDSSSTGTSTTLPQGSSSSGSADATTGTCSSPKAPESCVEGQERRRGCERCGTQAQRCEEGRWTDIGPCENQGLCEVGEIDYYRIPGKFMCGSHMFFQRCSTECSFEPIPDIPPILVSRCQPTECCGDGLGMGRVCLDPNNLQEGDLCYFDPPTQDEIGHTWMTRAMWEEFLGTIIPDR